MQFVGSLAGIIMVDILLSGDNALVIALACRQLAERQKKRAIFWGIVGAILLRIGLSFIIYYLLKIPYLQLVGGLILLWIAYRLARMKNQGRTNIKAAHGSLEAIKTIVLADLVMSLDNVIALAGIARGNIILLALGLGISIPVIVWGSQAIMWMMKKWPIIITVGAAFLGYTAGEMIVTDPKVAAIFHRSPALSSIVPFALGLAVVAGNFGSQQRIDPN